MRVATWNLGDEPDRAVLAGLVHLAGDHRVIGVCEAGSRGNMLETFHARTGWHVLRHTGEGRGHVALLTAPNTIPQRTGYYACTVETYVGPLGAGPSTYPPKGIVWADIPIHGYAVRFGVTHLVPSVQTPPFPGRTRRRRLYADHIEGITEWTTPWPTVLMGDFNATPDYFQLNPLRAPLDVHTRPTHGNRAIDHLWTVGVDVDNLEALDGYPSDHRPLSCSVQR